MTLRFFSLGACKEVTGSRHFLEIDGLTLQIDCGMFQGKREDSYNKNRNIGLDQGQISAVLLTHAHYDHSGALPLIVKRGFNGNIHSTSATRDVSQIILMDSAFIQQKDYEYIQEKAKNHPERGLKLFPPLYTFEDVMRTMKAFVTFDYHRVFTPLPGSEASFFNSGHILGSSSIHLNIYERIAIGFSGDLGRKGLPILRDPETMPAMDYLILEGTYGNRTHDSIDLAKDELKDIIIRAHSRGGKVIIPAFTIERTQELIYLIHVLRRENAIPAIPIFVDSPMAINATSIFKVHPECFDSEMFQQFLANHLDPFGFDGIHYTISTQQSIEINSFKGPAVIISASGMAESGRILHHLANHVENPKNIIAIVGFMAQHTLGRKLVEHEPKIKIFGKSHEVKAEISTLNAFSGHADHQEIKEWVSRHDRTRLKAVFLVHGEDEALQNLQKILYHIGIKKVIITESNQKYDLS